MRTTRTRISYANVMATLAVFIALGGTVYAGTQLPKDSVGAKQIAKNAVKDSEIADNAVDTSEVEQGSLLSADFAAGQLPAGQQGIQGLPGQDGQDGQNGQDGAQGPPGPTFAATSQGASPGVLPSPPEGSTIDLVTFTLPSPGRVFVYFGASSVSVNCDPNANGTFGLYVDSTPVPQTEEGFVDNTTEPYELVAVSDPLTAGAHTLKFGGGCDGASAPSFAFIANDSSHGVILLGS